MRPKFKSHSNYVKYTDPKQVLVHSFQPVDKQTARGVVRTYDCVLVDCSKPLTPQTGIDTFIGDISFAASHGMTLEHRPVLLSVVGRGNPLDAAKFMEASAQRMGKYFTDFEEAQKQQNNNNE